MPPPDSSGSSNNGFNPRNAEDVFAEFFASTSKPYGFENMGRAKSMRFQTEGAGTFGGFGGSESRYQSSAEGGSGAGGVGGGGGTSHSRKPPPVETKLPCSLEELYTGSTRKMKISRNVLRPNGYVQFFDISTLFANAFSCGSVSFS